MGSVILSSDFRRWLREQNRSAEACLLCLEEGSSTPVLGSLLSSISESPNNYHQSELHGATPKHTPNSNQTKLSCTNGKSQNVNKSFFCSPSVAEIKSTNASPHNGFRRVQSAGNLEDLADAQYSVDEFSLSKKFARKPHCRTLEAIPSFSVNSLGSRYEDDDSDEESEELDWGVVDNPFRVENLVLEEFRTNSNDYGVSGFEGGGKMYLATGLGVSGVNLLVGGGGDGGSGGGGSYRPVAFDRDGGDSHGISMEEHYKRMLEKKGDLEGAEEYYSRAILADPEDGEILTQYAKLIWELHHDKERALNYFERAVQASSEDSHIHAAYASFLWDIDGDEDEDEKNGAEESQCGPPIFHHGFMASASA
ncbi:hypothetical protein BUALT_Bualt02G0199300 [Buddleja alternifolia]|uniref:Uncharacterized protein n=1 Tax=Buddleja alternifolia TaxID=168488 RepID=A0AAV6Y1Q2_9LAMI|nr:hypothetical protein BUALT_Bualt02G0199300 [Buddleja alternifolia]